MHAENFYENFSDETGNNFMVRSNIVKYLNDFITVNLTDTSCVFITGCNLRSTISLYTQPNVNEKLP